MPTFVKEVFCVLYGLVFDNMTHLWQNETINTKSINIFLILGSNATTFVKEVFYISYGLICDEMTHLWQNEPIALNLVIDYWHWDQI